jgi:hypothetical protein
MQRLFLKIFKKRTVQLQAIGIETSWPFLEKMDGKVTEETQKTDGGVMGGDLDAEFMIG